MAREFQACSIAQLVEDQVDQTPHAIAVIDQQQQITYRELNQQANQLAHYLRTLGVKPETLVGVCVDRSLAMVVALLGILKAGGAYVPLDPTYPQERLAFTLADAQISILVTQTDLATKIPASQATLLYLDAEPILTQQSRANLPPPTSSQHLAYVIYTSGSTGQPKGVAIEHRNTLAFIDWAQGFFTAAQLRGVLASTSLCFDLSVFELWVTLSCGGTVILVPDALQLSHLPAKSKVTLINTVPSAIAALLHSKSIPASVTTINLAGEPLQNSLVQQLYQLPHVESVFNLYGPSEDTTYSTVALAPKAVNTPPPIGQPIAHTQIYLIETPACRETDTLRLALNGTPGEIYIAGAGLARGYLNRPQLTAEKFVPNPFSRDPDARLYKTGDLAVYLPDGNLKYLGRIDNQVKIRGFRVELGDIEAALSQSPLVKEAVVVAKTDASGNQRLVAYVVPAEANEVNSTVVDSDIATGAVNFAPVTSESIESIETDPLSQQDRDQLNQWQMVWSATYRQVIEANETVFDSAGWVDSFTGLPIPPAAVEEWVNGTAARILTFRPQRVLEIGCGRGLLLDRIAPHCRRYAGIDLAQEAVQTIQARLQQRGPDWSHVSVTQAMAHQLDVFASERFDTIILNSVIQYFPGIDYLLQVLNQAADLIETGGQIFIGDVRNLSLLEAFHTGVQLNQASDQMSCDRLRQQIRDRIAQEKELVLAPDFFSAVQQAVPRITHVQTQLKRGQSTDELTRFRSDVILHIDKPVQPVTPLCLDWQQGLSLTSLCDFLKTQQPEFCKVVGVPNARFASAATAVECLRQQQIATVGELKQQVQKATAASIHPESFWGLDLPYKIEMTWSDQSPYDYDVTFQHQSSCHDHQLLTLPQPPIERKPWTLYCNTRPHPHCVPHLRNFLQEKLPDYMQPTAFVILSALPLTLNGKIDRRALPDPKQERPLLATAYTPLQTPLQKQLAQIWSQVLGVEQIGIHDSFFELGGHSLLTIQLVAQIETLVQIELPLFHFLQEPTIAGLELAIDRLRRGNSEFKPIDWAAETELDSTIQSIGQVETTEPQFIFLTGATGFLGAFLLQELLHQTQAQIFCLVRAASFKAGQQKLQATLEQYQIWQPAFQSRVVPVLGDLTQPQLGLHPEQFEELAAQLDLIYHCGAAVNLVYPYTALRAANVLGTQEILRLASQGKVTPVHYISTIDVLKPLVGSKLGQVQEDEYCDNPSAIDAGYTQTKWVAEKLIQAAQQRGIPTCIYRPGMLSSHSQTGASHPNDLIGRLIKGMIQLNAAPDLSQSLNLTPIDYASKAIVHLSRKAAWGKAFHILHPQAIPWQTLIDQIRHSGYPIRSLPLQIWQDRCQQTHLANNILQPILPLLIASKEQDSTYLETFLLAAQAFDMKNTDSGLADLSLACPTVNAELLSRYFTFLQQIGFLKQNEESSQTKETRLFMPQS